MLSMSQILKSLSNSGEREDSFSPDWHARNLGVGMQPVLRERVQAGEHSITLKLRYVLCPSGDITIMNVADGEPLPEGCSFTD